MRSALAQLNDRSLQRMLEALTSGRLSIPVSSLTLAQLVPREHLDALSQELTGFQQAGLTAPLLVEWIRILLQQREQFRSESGRLELVMTGPEPPGAMVRDTGVVVRQMFLNATHSIWICGFVVYQGKEVFQTLTQRMTQIPELRVRMFLNIDRPYGDSSPSETLIARFQQRFRETQWPCDVRLPEIYFDPRALTYEEAGKSACLHAKFVLADSRQVFISSANFTEAAQQRNIESGLLSEHPSLAEDLRRHFQSLIDHGHLHRLRWH